MVQTATHQPLHHQDCLLVDRAKEVGCAEDEHGHGDDQGAGETSEERVQGVNLLQVRHLNEIKKYLFLSMLYLYNPCTVAGITVHCQFSHYDHFSASLTIIII